MTPLSARERDVAQLVAAGLTNKRLAARLGLSVSRVEGIVNAIAAKWRLDRSMNLRVQIANRMREVA